LICGIGCYNYVGSPGFFDELFFVFTLSLTINFDTIKDMVISNRDDVKTVRDDYKITRDHKRLQDSLRQKSHHAGCISILVGSGNLVGIVLRSTGDKLYYSVVRNFIGEIY
jgi:hypothetical protein